MNNSSQNIANSTYICSGTTEEEFQMFTRCNWWIDGLGQLLLCSIGLTGNTIAIPLLCSRKLNSVFYRLLVCLALFDNAYLICSLLESLRSHMTLPWDMNNHTLMYIYILYPIHNIVLCCSIYITAAIAFERCYAVCRPVEYRNRILTDRHSSWIRVLITYFLPVIGFCIIFNIPKFYELDASEYKDSLNQTRIGIKPTPLRLNDNYIVYYHHYTRLIVTGIVPFCSLAVCNFKIYRAVMQRKKNQNGGRSSDNDTDNRQAILLILIVLMFLVCNTPRIFLTLKETFSAKQWKEDYLHGCKGLPLWLLFMGSISHLLLTFNSSLNFFLYCVMSSSFRNVIKSCFVCRRRIKSVCSSETRVLQMCVSKTRGNYLHTEMNQDGVLMTSL